MKVKEKDLVVGDEYYLDSGTQNKGIFVGVFNGSVQFYPTSDVNYGHRPDGTVGFIECNYEYEEA